MISFEIITIFIITAAKSTITAFEDARAKECIPNKIYKRDDVTCFCSADGQWPHQNCSLVFAMKSETICEPDSYVKVDCNICKCNKRGNIEKNLCTKHICNGISQNTIIRRRSNNDNGKCEPNHWYSLSKCRFCYCINGNNLLCSSGISKERKVFLSKYELTDCGTSFFSDITKLFSVKNPFTINNNIIRTAPQEHTVQTDISGDAEASKQDALSIFFNHQDSGRDEELDVGPNDNNDDGIALISDVESNSEPENERNRLTEKKSKAALAANTLIPFSNEKHDFDNVSNELENLSVPKEPESGLSSDNKESDDQDLADPGILTKVRNRNATGIIQKNESNEIQDNTALLTVDIPGVLKKMFQFGRRSRVSLENADCVQGSIVTVKCNNCFCLKNGKMLCTKNKCN